jgi:nitrosocyanin
MNKTTGAIIAVVVLVVLAGGVFFYQSSKSSNSEPTDQTLGEQSSPTEVPSPDMSAMDSSASPSGQTQGTVKQFSVTGSNFKFAPNTLTVNKGDKVKITFQNTGGIHDFVIDEFKVETKRISEGQTDSVEFTADKAGSYEFYCSVGNHRQMGMKGTLVVL